MIKDHFIFNYNRLMDAATKQQQTLAKNIANQHTAGYMREEVDFDSLIRGLTDEHSIRMESNRSDHLMSMRERQNVEIEPIKTNTPIKPGEINNVDIDQEMAETARTQLYYAMLAKRMKNKFHKLTMGINGRT